MKASCAKKDKNFRNSSAPYVEVGAFHDIFAASRLYQRRSSLAISVSSDSRDKELKRVAFL
jgi:hypothetical protein